MAMAMPIRISIGMRVIHVDRSSAKRLLNQKTSGVAKAQSHDSMYSSAIGPAGDAMRKPKPRGSRTRFTAESVARNVQNAKMKRSSRLLNLQRGLALLVIINAAVQSISLLPRFSTH